MSKIRYNNYTTPRTLPLKYLIHLVIRHRSYPGRVRYKTIRVGISDQSPVHNRSRFKLYKPHRIGLKVVTANIIEVKMGTPLRYPQNYKGIKYTTALAKDHTQSLKCRVRYVVSAVVNVIPWYFCRYGMKKSVNEKRLSTALVTHGDP